MPRLRMILAMLFATGATVWAAEGTTMTTPAGTTHEMVLVPAGPFEMGSTSGAADEQPLHTVELASFYIGKYEATAGQYVAFMNAIDVNGDGEGHEFLNLDDPDVQVQATGDVHELRDPQLANHPVVEVSWYGAQAYCGWAGLRLPTEAEWEKAARGTDGRTYPWGEGIDGSKANYLNSGDAFDNGTTPVGLYPDGASAHGALDMTGNVTEWVWDWYDAGYYGISPEDNPQGPPEGSSRVFRGGSHENPVGANGASFLYAANRDKISAGRTHGVRGFRCAQDVASSTAVLDEDESPLPNAHRLWQNSPNPFNPTTTIRYMVSRPGPVNLVIYDILGRRVRGLVEESVPAGTYSISWDGSDDQGQPAATGVYFYLLRADGFASVRRMAMIR